jgi:TM2 domain-containing membrane protein YozV
MTVAAMTDILSNSTTTTNPASLPGNTHSKLVGYILWVFGFTGAHRFYYGRPVTGTIWMFTFGLLGIGWLIDLFLIPRMDREASHRYVAGPASYNIAWLLHAPLGLLGLHRLYLGKWWSGGVCLAMAAICAFTAGIMAWILGPIMAAIWIYDFWTLNDQVSAINALALSRTPY